MSELNEYNFAYPTMPTKVEHFLNQTGLLVWYWDDAFADNNVTEHPGGGLILPIDSHPKINKFADGDEMRLRLNACDSPFTTVRTNSITIHEFVDGSVGTVPSQAGVPVFDDSQSYWVAKSGADGAYKATWNSVQVPNAGTPPGHRLHRRARGQAAAQLGGPSSARHLLWIASGTGETSRTASFTFAARSWRCSATSWARWPF